MHQKSINLKDFIAEYPDFPKPGINFKDISPMIANPRVMKYVCREMAEKCRGADTIAALDARGFIFAPLISQILGIPWIMVRKSGKLPGETVQMSYDLEYGSNSIELQKDSIHAGDRVALVDDLLATGGTALGAIKLIESLGGLIHACVFLISLDSPGLQNMPARKGLNKYSFSSIVQYTDE